MLGYDSVDAVSKELDDSRGYLSLTKVAKYLEGYQDLSTLVYSKKILKAKRSIQPEYRKNMKEKVGESKWNEYEGKVKETALLLLKLNADLLTDTQRKKLGISEFVVLDDITMKDKISKLIDSKEFSDACRIEDEFACQEARGVVSIIRGNSSQTPIANGQEVIIEK